MTEPPDEPPNPPPSPPGSYPYGYPLAGGYPPHPQYPAYPPYGYPPGYPYGPPQGARRISAGMVILGLVIGSVGWVALFIATAAVLDRFFDAASQPSVIAVSLFWMGAGGALLISPKTRQAGAGLLMGLAIAVIVWAGLCAALLRG